ncbi:MAG: hypothetical protein IAB19_06360 [Proteobacteria bacterium]|uniref:Cell division protein ZipA n=1 Tax=Candidatus Avisuccinivibrio stercorigallinarum TaxID=2840704 RepID=A0A9D9DAA3_9GAMM|nr:hypothetical protein [Candidatus Avisuccinivibrio stercorigallinarum]
MSFFSDPSALVLIVGGVAIIAFLVHGLWFSGKPENRRLNKADRRDDELRNASNIGKVRIVTTGDTQDSTPEQRRDHGFNSTDPDLAGTVIEELSPEQAALLEQEQQSREQKKPLPQNIEINLVAEKDRPYRGEDIEELCNHYGIMRGDLNIYYVYENPQAKENEVFRMCSLKSPYSFPENMQGFTTPAIALYMNLPERGKAWSYFRAMLTAVDIFVKNLGGTLQDNSRQELTPEQLNELESKLQEYDAKAEYSQQD